MEFKRNYLTSDEIGYIVSNMLQKETSYERYMLAYSLTAQLLIDGLVVGENDDCNSIYTKVISNGIQIEKEVINFNLIKDIIDGELNTATVISKVLNEAIESINQSLNEIDFEKLLVEMNELQTKTEAL